MPKAKKKNTINNKTVKHIAQLANIPINEQEAANLSSAFNETLEVVNELQNIDTKKIDPTHQVTGLENAWRKDEVEEDRMFTQKEALANAKKTHQGYFVVPRIIHKS